jgi:Glycosyltransferase family 87
MDLGAAPTGVYPYPYPPFFLLMILPIGVLVFYWAFAVWDVSTLFIYLAASFHKRRCIFTILFTSLAPAALLNLNSGQTGFLSAALILGGFRFAEARPILGGTLFGLASFKPQLGLLIPIALISARLWRPLAAAGATIAILIVTSSVAFGWSIWPTWLAKVLTHSSVVLEVPNRFNPTVTANLTFLGVELGIARIVQISVAVLVGIVIWLCFRRGVTLLATAALLVGTFLATPYAFLYDMPMLTNAALMVIRHKDQAGLSLTIPEAAILLLSLVIPPITMETWRPAMFRSIPLFLLLGLIVQQLFTSAIERNRSSQRARDR